MQKWICQKQICVYLNRTTLTFVLSHYQDCISELLSKHALKITKCIKEIPDCPWYTSELNKLKRERRKAEYKWRKSKSEQDHKAFRRCRNRFRNKKLLKVLESLTSRKNDTPYPEHSSVDQLANKFGQFFMEKLTKLGMT